MHQKTSPMRRIAQQGVKLGLKKPLEHLVQRSLLLQQRAGLRSDSGNILIERSQIQRMFILKGGVEAATANAGRLDEILNRYALVAAEPKRVHGFFEHPLGLKCFLSCHKIVLCSSLCRSIAHIGMKSQA